MLLYEADEDCIIFYSECNFKGSQYEFCKDTESFASAKIDIPIKSIKIPESTSLIGYESEHYKGGKIEFKESVECIESYNFSFMEIKKELRWKDLSVNLRSRTRS